MKSEDHYFKNIATVYAVEKLICYGLEQFSDCAEWFVPIIDLFFRPWSRPLNDKGVGCGPLSVLKSIGVREYLFESGDGINVYVEEVANNLAFAKVLQRWLKHNSSTVSQQIAPFQLNINVAHIIKEFECVFEYTKKDLSDKRDVFRSVVWTPKGYLLMMRYYNLLLLLRDFPTVVVAPNNQMGGSVEEMHLNLIKEFIFYIEKNIVHNIL